MAQEGNPPFRAFFLQNSLEWQRICITGGECVKDGVRRVETAIAKEP